MELDRVLPVGTKIRIGDVLWTTGEPLVLLTHEEMTRVLLDSAENERLKKHVAECEAAKAGQPRTITVLGVGIGVGLVVGAGVTWALSRKLRTATRD